MTVTLHHGDCMQILPTLEAGSVDAILTDLPYQITACKWDEIIPFAPMWEQVKRILKPRGVFVTTASQPFTSKLIMSNLDWFKYEWIWDKQIITGHLDANRKPLKRHENICVFSENRHVYSPQKEKLDKPRWKGNEKTYPERVYQGQLNIKTFNDDKYPTSILNVSNANRIDRDHPTQKPVALYEYLIKTYTNEGDTVLDFCMGSGTTGVACMNTGREFIGVEKEQNYFTIATRRIQQAQAARQMELL